MDLSCWHLAGRHAALTFECGQVAMCSVLYHLRNTLIYFFPTFLGTTWRRKEQQTESGAARDRKTFQIQGEPTWGRFHMLTHTSNSCQWSSHLVRSAQWHDVCGKTLKLKVRTISINLKTQMVRRVSIHEQKSV